MKRSKKFNFQQSKILLPSSFNFDYLEHELSHYKDKQIIQFLKYGFPLGHDGSTGSRVVPKNHAGARFYHKQVRELLDKEVRLKAAIGPFREPPFENSCFSPLNSVPKKGTERRLILDMSFPAGNAINDGIHKDWYLNEFQKLTLPSIDNLVDQIMKLGRGCKVFKVDLSRAYRQIFIDFSCVDLLGYFFDGFYWYDCSLSMGSRSSAKCCQKVTDAVVYIFTNHGYFAINYLDDLGSAEEETTADAAFNYLQQVLRDFGLKEALNKSVAPCTTMIFLGIEVNTLTLTICIPKEKWDEIMTVLDRWTRKKNANLKDTQKLAGILNFACRCVRSGRIYLSRILNFLRSLPSSGSLPIDKNTREDIDWWINFAPMYNGTSLMLESEWTNPDQFSSTDSCLMGDGILLGNKYVHWSYPTQITNLCLNINQFECLMVVVAVKVFSEHLARKKLVIFCDNQNTVLAVNTGRSRDVFMQKCLRELHVSIALANCDIRTRFLEGASNREADALSRWDRGRHFQDAFKKLMKGRDVTEVRVVNKHWEFALE